MNTKLRAALWVVGVTAYILIAWLVLVLSTLYVIGYISRL